MTTKTLSVATDVTPVLRRAAACGAVLFGVFALAGPALEIDSQVLIGSLVAIQALAVVWGAPLIKELTFELPRLEVDEYGVVVRHFGDDWLRTVPWSRVNRLERTSSGLQIEVAEGADPEAEDSEAFEDTLSLKFITTDLAEIDAVLETYKADRSNVVPMRKKAA